MSKEKNFTYTQLRDAINGSLNWTQTLTQLGMYQNRGKDINFVRKEADRLEINYSHFTNKRKSPRVPLANLLVENSKGRIVNLRKRLIKAGLKEAKCEECDLTEWREKPIPLELDHINGIVTDNRLENLRILCSNCHAQTPTHSKVKKVNEKV